MAKYNKVLLLDGDGIPAENWGQEMTKVLDEPQVAIVGSKIIPRWLGKPNFLTKSSVVLEQYAMHDLGSKDKYCKKAIGVSYGFDKEKLVGMEYFDEKLSRRRGILLCGAETDLCDRVIKAGLKIKYIASTYAEHQVSKERCELKYALKRVFYAGVTRRYRGGLPSPNQKKKNIYDFLYGPIIAAAYLGGYASQKIVFEKHQIHKTPSEQIAKE
jgi:GT2 family glycosyltransferase